MPGNKKTPIWTDPDDAPELTDEFFERAALMEGDRVLRPAQGTLTKRGRPKLENPKRQITLRLDSDLIDRLRESGPGWQSRINEILRKAV
ncbi:BrnA antitoxin family protein [Phenylobacterium sp. 20VBR1]|uniref:BrnA antitoxin family protein n=1 Tax=Phenylobacterium glaciei TaxID=2803784 RepID=A0A941HV84_9CAUL|nr:BrnA antitoxin family protein [Phenylobacterium glaciei]MBR7618345.1 BrnA antitoxin family protein [Phenylobacterium glaciei]QQZ50792.1 BrnA antitoxin family protein [Phenylobacterium glaciei]